MESNLSFIECQSDSLYRSISHVLKRTLLKKKNGFIIKANSFTFLSKGPIEKPKLTPLQLLQMAETLYQQFLFLKSNERKGFVQLQESYLLCIDGNKFVYLNEDDMYDLDGEGEKLLILSPFAKEEGEDIDTYKSREVMNLTAIPSSEISWESIIVALGLLLQSYYESENRNIKSPLFYFIERCIEERKFLYI